MKKLFLLLLLSMFLMGGITACQSDNDVPVMEGVTQSESPAETGTEASVNGDTDSVNNNTVSVNERDGALGLLWEVAVDDTVIYLLGTIHILNDTVYPFDSQLLDIVLSSDAVIFEADFGDYEGLLLAMMDMIYTDGTVLSDYISTELFDLIVETLGVTSEEDLAGIQIMRPWALASQLTMLALQLNEELGLMAGASIDESIYNIAVGAGIPVMEIEGWQFQVDLFNTFSDEVLEDYLRSALDGLIGESTEVIEEMENVFIWLEAWRDRDPDAFIAAFELDEDDPMTVELLTKRDALMYEYIWDLIENNEGQFMIVVGAGHMLSSSGLVTRFLADGYDVKIVPR